VAAGARVHGWRPVAWVNGSLYLELHGREDGRTRNVVFIQMGVLVLLAVFTADAADGSGRGFALVYATFLAVMTWLWYSVRRQDRQDRPEFLPVTGRYVIGIGVAVAVVITSAFLPEQPRLVVWGVSPSASSWACCSCGARESAGRAWLPRIRWSSASVCSRSSSSAKSCSVSWTGCLAGARWHDDHDRDDRTRDRLRLLVDLLRPGRPPSTAE
jgi:Bacterial low temperature requirement A protein (LtrA)